MTVSCCVQPGGGGGLTCTDYVARPQPALTRLEGAGGSWSVDVTWTTPWAQSSVTNRHMEFYFGESQDEVDDGCRGVYSPACLAAEPDIPAVDGAVNTRTVSNLDPGTRYYVRVVHYGEKDGDACSVDKTEKYLSSCTLTPSLPCQYDATAQCLDVGQTENPGLTSAVEDVVNLAQYTSDNEAVVTLRSNGDTSYPFSTKTKGEGQGSATVTGEVFWLIGDSACADTAAVYVGTEPSPPPPSGPWWQVTGGNVHADSGAIVSNIPATATEPYLILQSGANDTGLLSYPVGGSVNLGSGTINENGSDWQAETVYSGTRTGFAYFRRILSDDPAGIGAWDGSLPSAGGVYQASGNVTTSGSWSVGAADKFVLLVDGNVTIDANIDVAPGGFLAVIASGDIIVSDSVTNIEGVFISDGNFNTGTGAQPLTGEGIFTGWNGVTLARDLADVTPAEKFIYRPDLQLNAYRYLLWLGIAWQEVAP